MFRITTFLVCFAIAAGSVKAAEVGFVEDFALARDRAEPLKQLIPGTEDYYYYHCLHFQNTEQFDKVDELLGNWVKRHGYTARVKEIRNRQALLTYAANPAKTLDFLRQELNLRFDHKREVIGERPNLPTALDQQLIERQRLTQQAMQRYKNLDGFEDSALEWLAASELDADRRRNLLQRLQRPDLAGLPKLVVDDLNYKYSGGFGSFPIHRQLLLSQLDECLKLKPDLLNQTNFVNTYLAKLRPREGVDWQNDDAEHEAYLDRLWGFVSRLAPVHNSLKANVLYRRLMFDRTQGVYDKDRFMQYIKLPRNVPYIAAEFMKREESRQHPANLQQDFSSVTLLPIVGNDEPLVRSYLQHFFIEEITTEPYEPYINDKYLTRQLAETKILHGLGEAERWFSLLTPTEYQALKDRVDIDFAETNGQAFGPDDEVALDVHVKNVKTLIVKVFEINTANFYQQQQREVNTDIELDGLVANQETTYEYSEPSLRRVRRHFEFPDLKRRGVYVIDFIGNGKNSRVVIRKGKLRHVVRTSVAGHIFTILDEQNRQLKDARLWLGGRQYEPDDDGTIAVPFTNNPGRRAIVLSHGDFSSLDYFEQQSENYSLAAGIYVDREALVRRKQADVVIRPGLTVSGTPVGLSVLEDVTLVINSTDHDGVSTVKEVKDFELHQDKDSVYAFQVPDRLSEIQFTLKARVQNLSQNKKVDLSASESFSLNQIDRSDKIQDLHLSRAGGVYQLSMLGKSGEPLADRAVPLELKHRDFRNPVNVSLQTDAGGNIVLGSLDGITQIKATTPEGVSQAWPLVGDRHTYQRTVHGNTDQGVAIPLMTDAEMPSRDEISLLEVRDNTFVQDHFDAVQLDNGILAIRGLPAGDYDLLLKPDAAHIRLRLSEGETRDGYVLGENRLLEARNRQPLQIRGITTGDDRIAVQLTNANDHSRVHVIATRYVPAFDAFAHLRRVGDIEPFMQGLTRLRSLYLEGRDIGDEYRYIIDRKYAKKFPGNMLNRPSLLLNPWPIRSTESQRQIAAEGEAAAPRPEAAAAYGGRNASKSDQGAAATGFSTLDFLGEPAVVLTNLVPDENGVVSIEREKLGGHQQIQIVAVDPRNTVYRSASLPPVEPEFLDLRLALGLDPQGHFTQQKQASVVPAKGKFELADITSSRFEAYDSLAKVYSLYLTLTSDPKLVEFSFIVQWPDLTDEQKREKYSKYACHELNFFLAQKDPAFFEKIVRPFVSNKRDKTFLDHWLIGDDLQQYLQPWEHARLNIVERILLGRRIQADRALAARHVQELTDLLPPNIDRENQLFMTLIKGSALDVDADWGFANAAAAVELKEQAAKLKMFERLSMDDARDGRALLAEAGRDQAEMNQLRKAIEKKQAEHRELAEESLARRARSAASDAKDAAKSRAVADQYFADEARRRQNVQQYYRKLDKTQEWVENNYYRLPIEQQNADLVTTNSFWNEYAHLPPDSAFLSSEFAEASHNFTEMMFALSVLDLPFVAGDHQTQFDQEKMAVTAASPMIVFHEEIEPADPGEGQASILVSENFFRHGDRYRYENNQKLDKYVTDEFLVHTVYGCQIVVTNPTSARQTLDLLLQIPVGSLPVSGGQATGSKRIDLEPYSTTTIDYFFYFPADGKYPHFPVHVSRGGELLAFGTPLEMNVVEQLSRIDRESWQYISQNGTSDDVIGYLNNNNLQRTPLDKIAFRMGDGQFFETVTGLLVRRHVYNHTLFSYSIKHNAVPQIREYLQHSDSFVAQCGATIESPILTIDPVERKTYQHMDYKPLVNARAHQLGRSRVIVNDRLAEQYDRLLQILSYHRQLDDEDLMAVTYYLLLQDRVAEAIAFFERVDAKNLATRMQYDYFTAYLDFYRNELDNAKSIVAKYEAFPVDQWQQAFANVGAQLEEIDANAATIIDQEDRTQQQTNLAASQPSFEFRVEDRKVHLNYQHLAAVDVHYYRMDIELLFSRNPFVQQFSNQFAYIRPNGSQRVELPREATSHVFALPEPFQQGNVLVEIVAAGQTKTQAYYANTMAVQVVDSYGQLRVATANPGKPISTAYVKVYAKMQDGSVQFYKDGYTDLRGRFDYASLNTDELLSVDKFSLLIISDEHGAVIREANPPQR